MASRWRLSNLEAAGGEVSKKLQLRVDFVAAGGRNGLWWFESKKNASG
jgi:hypothetical protein